MKSFPELLNSFSKISIPILELARSPSAYTPLDLSSENSDLIGLNITDPDECQYYIDTVLGKNAAQVAYGGYLEKRSLYADNPSFSEKAVRNIHLGLDFWAKAGTKVLVPITGTVHSFQNNAVVGDYGPTIILRHEIGAVCFYTLYGHLSVASLEELYIGKSFLQGETLAKLGTPDINVNYAPHLHFQIIHDMEGKKGDYPGVCSEDQVDFYAKNCPDPNKLLKITL